MNAPRARAPPICDTAGMRTLVLRSVWIGSMLSLATGLTTALAGCMPASSVAPRDLSVEFRTNPRGMASVTPRLSWRVAPAEGSVHGARASAYRVIVAASPRELASGAGTLWDTGVVACRELPMLVEYAGKPLASRSAAWWKVRIWDETGLDSGWSQPASFSVGLLHQEDWGESAWIGLDSSPAAPLTAKVRDELRRLPLIREPGPPARSQRSAEFQATFTLGPSPVRRAWFAGSVDQLGSVRFNQSPESPLARWDMIRPIDATSALVAGPNTITIRVDNEDGFNPAATGMLVVTHADGTEQRVTLDKSWVYRRIPDAEWKPVEVAASQPWGGNRNVEHFLPPAPYLRTVFTPDPKKTVASATLYSTALGVYEPRLNGARVGRDEFAPGWTEYTKRVYHQTYDVTPMIVRGPNCLGAILGDGWYAGLMGYTGRRNFYNGPARFKARLELVYTDGTIDTVVTGPRWAAGFGPIISTDNYLGSAYDAREELPGWDTPAFDASAWRPADIGLAFVNPPLRELDVTQKVRDLLRTPGATFKVGPDVLGEPCFGVVKTLRIDYFTGRTPRSASFNEGEAAALPLPGESGEVTIVSATFGEPPPAKPQFIIEPQPGEPVRRFEELPSIAVTEPRPGRYVFDLGQNMVGWTRIRINGKAGQRLTLRHAEMLNPEGTPYTSNLRGATATDFFTLKDGPQTLEPPFTFHGFRYVEVSGLTSPPEPGLVTGIVVHTNMSPTGTFTTSSPLVNQLVHNIVWGQKGNYLEVPTDCPQRDERLGWTGDAQFFINAAAYNFDIASFMSRWLRTLNHDAQFDDGTLAHVAPKVNERGGSTAWGDAGIVCIHALYRTYGDTRVIADNYGPMTRYMAWLDSKTTAGLAKVGGFGDWVNLGDPTSQDLIDTAQRIQLLGEMAEMASVIGNTSDAQRYAAQRDQSIAAFRARFLAADGSLKDSGQTGYAMAFTIQGILPDETRGQTSEHFVAAIAKKDWHLATGFIGTPRLLPALFAAGKDDVAYRLLLNDDFPSWLYQVKLGATTMWERWDGWTPERGFQDVGMNSFNHYAFGAVGDALYRHVAGISALEPGYRKVLIEPRPDLAPTAHGRSSPQLTHAEASYRSISGEIRSAWRLAPNPEGAPTVAYSITIPPHTNAQIRLRAPYGATVEESGKPFTSYTTTKPPGSPRADGKGDNLLIVEAGPGSYRFVVKP